MKSQICIVTIDGPGGSGKGTLSGLLAATLGWHLLDSGALYRLTAFAALKQGVSLDDEQRLVRVAEKLDVIFEPGKEAPGLSDIDSQIPFATTNEVFLASERVTDAIRTEEIGACASRVAVLPAVRKALLQRQREFARMPGLVADGRDMGTVVFPAAHAKFFLEATIKERAKRRWKQLQMQGQDVSLSTLEAEIATRDKRDRERTVAPLKPAEDAVLVDSTAMSAPEVLKRVLTELRNSGIALAQSR